MNDDDKGDVELFFLVFSYAVRLLKAEIMIG